MIDWGSLRIEKVPWPRRRASKRDCTVADWRNTKRRCPNCDTWFPAPSAQRVYCSTRCELEAKAVRYGRGATQKYGSNFPSDVAGAMKMKLAHALGGSYDRNARRIPRLTRLAVRDRDNNRCVNCGAADPLEIDHIDGDSNEPGNLQLLCLSCHPAKTSERMRPIADPAMQLRWDGLMARLRADQPAQPCDVPGWDYAGWIRDHQRPAAPSPHA